ncbi:MAG: histidine--tRNA ligase [bacterium]|nr:histidine--tRNA ligase [bacterium]MBU1917269.1 histidine--tRNA ligase [bacterium]
MTKLQTITGMADILPEDIGFWHVLEKTARTLFETYGFEEIRTPIVEDTRLFQRGIGENSQVVQKEMYTFDDKGGDSVTMRPEGTASVMRAYLQHSLMAKDAITKLYYMGPMFRYERPQKGRLRQFHQIGVELMGIDSPLADAEVVIMMDRLIRTLGISHYRLEINSLGTLEERKPYLECLVKHFTRFTDKLCDDCKKRLEKNPLRILDCKEETCIKLADEAPTIFDALTEQTKEEFDKFKKLLDEAGVVYMVNPRIVRGLDYYEKTAFEFVSDKLGSQSAFSAGGRYNRLALELGGKEVPSVGFSIGCERIIMLMKEQEFETTMQAELKGVYLAPLDEASFDVCQGLLQNLRDEGVRAEMDYQKKSMKAQMRRANKLDFRYVVIMGEVERQKGIVTLKDLENGEQEEVKIEDLCSKFNIQ